MLSSQTVGSKGNLQAYVSYMEGKQTLQKPGTHHQVLHVLTELLCHFERCIDSGIFSWKVKVLEGSGCPDSAAWHFIVLRFESSHWKCYCRPKFWIYWVDVCEPRLVTGTRHVFLPWAASKYRYIVLSYRQAWGFIRVDRTVFRTTAVFLAMCVYILEITVFYLQMELVQILKTSLYQA